MKHWKEGTGIWQLSLRHRTEVTVFCDADGINIITENDCDYACTTMSRTEALELAEILQKLAGEEEHE